MKKLVFGVVFFTCLVIFTSVSSVFVSAAPLLLKDGVQGSQVSILQKDLKTLGFLSIGPTGYYGEITSAAVKKLQGKYGLIKDGVAGPATLSLIDRLLGRVHSTVSRGDIDRNNYLIPWFGGAKNIFAKGKKAVIYDVDTGLSFNVQRSFGYNHADCETLTSADTAIMKKIYGGVWSWTRRAVIVTVGGKRIAASMAGMPHAGVDSSPGNTFVQWRSVGYGPGINLDLVKGNGMDGHFDVHFLGSKTHGTNEVDADHQNMVKKAAAWAKENY